MQIATVGSYAFTVGSLIAMIVILLAILGLLGILPLSQTVVFGLFLALAVARLT
jgi:hypothetical protein